MCADLGIAERATGSQSFVLRGLARQASSLALDLACMARTLELGCAQRADPSELAGAVDGGAYASRVLVLGYRRPDAVAVRRGCHWASGRTLHVDHGSN